MVVISVCNISAVFVIFNLASNIACLICMVCLHTTFYMPGSTGSLHMAIRLRAEAFSVNLAAVVFLHSIKVPHEQMLHLFARFLLSCGI